MADQSQLTLTPTEDLILDVLVARYRLGDTLWTFDSRNKPALRRLENKRLIDMHSPVTENTVRASITEDALREFGPSWFQLGITLGNLPDDPADGADDERWSKGHLQSLIGLPQIASDVDPRAINTAHLIMLGLIRNQCPVHRVGAGLHGAVNLYRAGGLEMQVAADGKTIRLRQHGVPPRLTGHIYEAVSFGRGSAGHLLRTS